MTIGLLGKKLGMTRVFTEDGDSIPVTVVEVSDNRITQIKTKDSSDAYNAVQITTGKLKANRVNKPMKGHFLNAKVDAGAKVMEFRVDEISDDYTVGKVLEINMFKPGQKVDVTGISRGFGFQGGIKRHNFRGLDSTHGNSISHRSNGSIGQCQTPGRVFKGKKMSGHMGAKQVTTQNLELVKIEDKENLILIKGAVPGAKGADVIINHAIKG